MQMEQQVPLDSGACPHSDNILCKDGTSGVEATSSSLNHDSPQQPVKKQARQRAAWTHQEEESFFTALRQVGKNFEKITSCVQSKNKDQVRHYYYRLVRRMNKLLGPELCLDAKNSKDTNAAMLRWWSLLENYKCKASELHLKPQIFKIFSDTLEQPLLKDQRKKSKKRRAQGEICCTKASATVSSQGEASVNDLAGKIVSFGGQNIQEPEYGKVSLLNCAADSIAEYKKLEKAAIAGTSLVADSAEHLECMAMEEVVQHVRETQGETGMGPFGKGVPPVPAFHNLPSRSNFQSSNKLKLQLFPIDEITRRALEMDNLNPHLELTITTRKKMSSILEHLTHKWGKSSIACGELVLLPFCAQREYLLSFQRWTRDSLLSAADVYAQVGSPSVFRLRYCWFSDDVHGAATFQVPLTSYRNLDDCRRSTKVGRHNVNWHPDSIQSSENVSNKLIDPHKDQEVSVGKYTELAPSSADVHNMVEYISTDPEKNSFEKDDMKLKTGDALSAGQWADTVINISMGDLLSETPDNGDVNRISPSLPRSSLCLQQIPFSCDSFDAAIAAVIHRQQEKSGFPQPLESHVPSILDSEQTCDAFSFQKNALFAEKIMDPSTNSFPQACGQSDPRSLVASDSAVKEFHKMEERMDDEPAQTDPMIVCPSNPHTLENSGKDLSGLCGLSWQESLGPLEMDVRSCKYRNESLISSENLGDLNHLIASSLDAFQNCSFLSSDKKETLSAVTASETASSFGFKSGGRV